MFESKDIIIFNIRCYTLQATNSPADADVQVQANIFFLLASWNYASAKKHVNVSSEPMQSNYE